MIETVYLEAETQAEKIVRLSEGHRMITVMSLLVNRKVEKERERKKEREREKEEKIGVLTKPDTSKGSS